ncbi:hypothetical protein TNCV_4273561 [Trichonephila clavipes]|nr:hypothetical protein TNCV_4273561 [Trichonephila clavipes]
MGKECVCICNEQKTCSEIQSGRQDIESRNATGSDRPSSSTPKTTAARIGEIIQNDRWITLSEISSVLGLSYGSISFLMCCDISRQCCEIIRRDRAQWRGT